MFPKVLAIGLHCHRYNYRICSPILLLCLLPYQLGVKLTMTALLENELTTPLKALLGHLLTMLDNTE